jgi:hypothetical protein
MGIDYPRMIRVTIRSEELSTRGDVIPIVRTVYQQKLAAPAGEFIASHKAIENAEKAREKERSEGLVMLAKIEQPYVEARTAMAIFIDDLALPKALSALSTATDKRDAIATMWEMLDERDDEPGWAKDLTDGPFGQLALEAIREITEWIAADGNLEKAVRNRAAAYAVAYPAFLAFRGQVRASYGKSSIHYRRLLVRSNGKLAVDDPTDTDPTGT